MKRIATIMMMCFCCYVFGATNTDCDTPSSVSTQLANVRYEFVQSPMNLLHAFLVDKYEGRVWRYRIMKKEFEEIARDEPDSVKAGQVNYQLYIGEDNTMCFLLNVHTGEMWRYGSKDGEKTFKKMTMPWDTKK